ncbi:unnamed protein product [Ectocarpus sp. 12 AP-2014]
MHLMGRESHKQRSVPPSITGGSVYAGACRSHARKVTRHNPLRGCTRGGEETKARASVFVLPTTTGKSPLQSSPWSDCDSKRHAASGLGSYSTTPYLGKSRTCNISLGAGQPP